MFKIIYPSNDSTLYEGQPKVNTGLDEILEIGKRLTTGVTSSYSLSRSLIKFDMNDVSNTLSKYNVGINDCKFILQLYTTHAKNLPSSYTINANVVGQDWTNGTGYLNYQSTPENNGCTWDNPKSGSYFWISSSQEVNMPSGSTLYISGSGSGGSWLYESGSAQISGSSTIYSQSFDSTTLTDTSVRPTDIDINITQAVKLWVSGSGGYTVPNYGFLLKFSDDDESDSAVSGFVRFFSRDSNTVYVPRILMYFDKSSFSTGSLSSIDLDSYAVYTRLKKSYKDEEVVKLRIFGRDKYPQRSPSNEFPMTTVKYLPSSSLYTVIDAATEETIVPYDTSYTNISCDSTSSFIQMDMSGLMPERYYRLEFKVVDGYLEEYISDKFYFKVTR